MRTIGSPGSWASKWRQTSSGPANGDRQDFGVGPTQPATFDEGLHRVADSGAAAADPIDEVQPPGPGEPQAIGHQDSEQLLLPRDGEVVEDEAGEPLENDARVVRRVVERCGHAFAPCVVIERDQRLEERRLARKVVVDGAVTDADALGNVAQAGAEEAAVAEQVERRIEDGLAGALSVSVLGRATEN